jgi:putative endonuclease
MKRFAEHSQGKVFATKGRLPLKLIFYEAFVETKDAIRREKYFKTNPGKRSLKLMLREFYKKLI